MAAVADVPDAEDRLLVGQQRGGGMGVILLGPRAATGHEDLPRRVVAEIDAGERLLVFAPQGTFLCWRRLPAASGGLRRRCDGSGILLREGDSGRKQQDGQDRDRVFHGKNTGRAHLPIKKVSPTTHRF